MKTVPYSDEVADQVIAGFDGRAEMLVQILHSCLERFGWICDDAIRHLAVSLNLSRAEIHGVVSYYHDFRTTPPGRHIVKVCEAESCQAVGARDLAAHAAKRLANEDVTLEPVYCLGNCACSPAVMVDGKTYGRVDPARFDEIMDQLAEPG